MKEKITFVIPAAGSSKRFGKVDKVFYKLKKNVTIIDKTINNIAEFAKKIIIVLNKGNYNKGKLYFSKNKFNKKIIFIKQSRKKGTAIAVRDALKYVDSKIVGVIWADQIGLTRKTIKYSLNKTLNKKFDMFVPINKSNDCYTNVILNKKNNIIEIKNNSNSYKINKKGINDCGFFLFSKKKISKILEKNITNKKFLNFKLEYDFINIFKNLKPIKSIAFLSKEKKEIIGINYLRDLKKIK